MLKVIENLGVWQNYLHYLLNAILLGMELMWINSLQMFTLSFTEWWGYLIIAVLLLINDSIIHFMFEVLPDPIHWSD